MPGLVGGAPGGRHRASPIHRRRTQNITYDDGEFGVGAERVRAATAAAPETDDADEAERAPLPAPQDKLRRSDENDLYPFPAPPPARRKVCPGGVLRGFPF